VKIRKLVVLFYLIFWKKSFHKSTKVHLIIGVLKLEIGFWNF